MEERRRFEPRRVSRLPQPAACGDQAGRSRFAGRVGDRGRRCGADLDLRRARRAGRRPRGRPHAGRAGGAVGRRRRGRRVDARRGEPRRRAVDARRRRRPGCDELRRRQARRRRELPARDPALRPRRREGSDRADRGGARLEPERARREAAAASLHPASALRHGACLHRDRPPRQAAQDPHDRRPFRGRGGGGPRDRDGPLGPLHQRHPGHGRPADGRGHQHPRPRREDRRRVRRPRRSTDEPLARDDRGAGDRARVLPLRGAQRQLQPRPHLLRDRRAVRLRRLRERHDGPREARSLLLHGRVLRREPHPRRDWQLDRRDPDRRHRDAEPAAVLRRGLRLHADRRGVLRRERLSLGPARSARQPEGPGRRQAARGRCCSSARPSRRSPPSPAARRSPARSRSFATSSSGAEPTP